MAFFVIFVAEIEKLKIHIEPQGTLKNKNNFEKEEQIRRTHTSRFEFENILQIYSHQSNVMLALKTDVKNEENRRDEPVQFIIHIYIEMSQ
jgi:hypothetical protein